MQLNPDTEPGLVEPRIIRTPSYWAVYEATRKRGDEHYDGDYLSSKGIYLETVQAMCVRNPNIRRDHTKYATSPAEYGKATVLELSIAQPFHVERQDYESSQQLSSYLRTNDRSLRNRLILLEGVAKNFVEVLGSYFNTDPSFFANQKRPNSWELSQFNIERTPNLPSLNNPATSFLIRYPEMYYFPIIANRTQLHDKYVKDLDGRRHVHISRRTREIDKDKDLKSGLFDNVGVVGRAASYWSRKYEDGLWDAIILVDPPVRRLVEISRSGQISEELKHVPFRGGYQDFIPYPEELEASRRFVERAAAGPSRVSMLEDICFYFIHHNAELENFGNGPEITTIFLKKITASNWLHLVDYFNASAHNLEYYFSRNEAFDIFTIPTIERWWGDIHSWHRRCVQHCEEMNAILIALRIPPDCVVSDQSRTNPMDSREDFILIYKRLLWTKSRFEHLLSSATGLNAIAANKEAMAQNKRYSIKAQEEARKASLLTFLATVFVPLAITAGIFSMSPEWAPGGEKFVYYWAITLPLVFLLGIVYYLFGRFSKNHIGGEENSIGQVSDVEKGPTKRD